MPVFSVIIPAYNNAEYLPKAIGTLFAQTFTDWEAVIVVDGSPDNAAEVACRIAEQDSRVVVLSKERNEGTHRARKTGVRHCSGDYAMFLDADDELRPDALQRLLEAMHLHHVDILHFGTELFGENMPKETCESVLSLSNRDLPMLHGESIVRSSFTQNDAYRQDWRILQRLYETPLLKRAFAAMTDARLGRGQDSYEWLVIASLARHEAFRNDIIAYRYFLGRGITTFAPMTVPQFENMADGYASILHEADAYSTSFSRFDLSPYTQELRNRLNEMLAGDWDIRIAGEHKTSAIRIMTTSMGKQATATELMRLARDHAYEQWLHPTESNTTQEHRYLEWFAYAEQLMNGEETTPRFAEFRQAASNHIADIRRRESSSTHRTSQTSKPALRTLLSRLFRRKHQSAQH